MPKPIQFDRQSILDAAFEIFSHEGLSSLSVRKIALAAGSSTAPIYSSFSGIDEIRESLLQDSLSRLIEFTEKSYTENLFLNTGVGVLEFAKQFPVVYRTIFMENENAGALFRKLTEVNRKQLPKIDYLTSLTAGERDLILDKLSIYTHGLAAMICAGILENTDTACLIALLDETGDDIIRATIHRSQAYGKHDSHMPCRNGEKYDENPHPERNP